MSSATSLLIIISYLFGRPIFKKDDWSLKNISLGIGSATVLYLIFWYGGKIIPLFIPDHANNLNSIYANMGNLSPALVAFLLFFPIGFGEEIFWRGYIQKKLTTKYGKYAGLIMATVIYAGVHIPTFNPVLILAALVCGLFWGYLYLLTDTIVVVLISHMIWDPLIFVAFPLN